MFFIYMGVAALVLALCVIILAIEVFFTVHTLRKPYPLRPMPPFDLRALKAGDLILYRYGEQSQSKIISYFSHVAITCTIDNQVMVAELNEDCRTSFDGYCGAMSIRPASSCLPLYRGLVCVRPRQTPLTEVEDQSLTQVILESRGLRYPRRPVLRWALAKLGLDARVMGKSDRNCAAFVCHVINLMKYWPVRLDVCGSFPGHLGSRELDQEAKVWATEQLYKQYPGNKQ